MEIKLQTIPVREVLNGFVNNDEEGVYGYGGRLNIRPKYQREFIYQPDQQKAVIDSIFKGFPLNVLYWVENPDGTYELLDGQQRTMSICSYCEGEFFVNVNGRTAGFSNLTNEEREHLLSYELQVYICRNGTTAEKKDWFQIVNIGGETLSDQELRNALYPGPWITSMKRRFGKSNCVAKQLADRYISRKWIRQEALEEVLRWISGSKAAIDDYMAAHQNDADSDAEWDYFQRVIKWVEILFPNYRAKLMKGLPWGEYYNKYKAYDAQTSGQLEARIRQLLLDKDVTNQKGIYLYLLSGDETRLSIRQFDEADRIAAYERQQGICPQCGQHYAIEEMHADHITPWSKGGHTTPENCQMLCADCNRRKSNV